MNDLISWIQAHPEQANAFAASITAILALLALIVSVVLTTITLWIQRRHNFKTVCPVADVSVSDYENWLAVKVKNDGIGPLLVKQLIVSDGTKTEDDIINFMPDLPTGLIWETFFDRIDGACILPNQNIPLISLRGNHEDTDFTNFRDQVRRRLSKLTLTIKYTDIYNRKMVDKKKALDWFGRHEISIPKIFNPLDILS